MFIILKKYFSQDWSLQMRRNVCEHQKRSQRMKLIFVFSGTALSTMRFISSSVMGPLAILLNCSAVNSLIREVSHHQGLFPLVFFEL